MTKIQIHEMQGFVKPCGNYVYIHYRKSNGKPFYVGVGKGNRYRQTRRTEWWTNCALKHGVNVEIIQDFESKDDAYLLEMWLIAKLRYSGENLVNITCGGAGKPHGIKRKKANYGRRYNSVSVYCSNGKVFDSFECAARWCRTNGYASARGSKISGVTDVNGRSVYGHAWSRISTPNIPMFTGRSATINGISTKKIKTVYCSNGMIFPSVTMASQWCAKNGHAGASQAVISSCLTGRTMTAYGYAWSYCSIPLAPAAAGIVAKSLSSRQLMKPVICVETGQVFDSIALAGEWANPLQGRRSGGNIGVAARNQGKTAYGYKWRFQNDTDSI